MAGARIPRVPLPPGTRLDTRAVREGLPPSEWGENSEALFLTSAYVQPDAATMAAAFSSERRVTMSRGRTFEAIRSITFSPAAMQKESRISYGAGAPAE